MKRIYQAPEAKCTDDIAKSVPKVKEIIHL